MFVSLLHRVKSLHGKVDTCKEEGIACIDLDAGCFLEEANGHRKEIARLHDAVVALEARKLALESALVGRGLNRAQAAVIEALSEVHSVM